MLARLFTVIALLLAAALPAQAGRLLDMEIIDRSTGEVLTTHRNRGETYVAGNPGNRYAVRLRNRTGGRLLAVLSVDGVNVVTGETASPGQSGYVLGPYESAEIAGWRKSLNDVAQFYFTSLPDSYAARTDRPDHVGVIGVAVFREKVRLPEILGYNEAASSASSPAAKTEAAAESKAQRSMQDRLGTGHGEREYAPTRHTDFERASHHPNALVAIRYGSRANLLAWGIIPQPRPILPHPNPFPGHFVPDPRG